MLGLILFPDNVEMRIGMFFTGCSPAGGASNIWTVILGGNIDLSITMTTISTLASFGMMPLWLFTLGKVIFDSGNMDVPYRNLATYVIGLIIPLAIGMLIKRYLPRVGNFLVRILKVLSIMLILFIVIFAIVTNLYLFELFTWQVKRESEFIQCLLCVCITWQTLSIYIDCCSWSMSAVDCLRFGLDSGKTVSAKFTRRLGDCPRDWHSEYRYLDIYFETIAGPTTSRSDHNHSGNGCNHDTDSTDYVIHRSKDTKFVSLYALYISRAYLNDLLPSNCCFFL